MNAISVKGSRMNIFHCGNLKTLKQEGIREALLKYHQDWYSSNIMKLVVLGKHSIEKMEGWLREMFKEVPNK